MRKIVGVGNYIDVSGGHDKWPIPNDFRGKIMCRHCVANVMLFEKGKGGANIG